MFLRNFLIMSFILSPAIILFGMIIFSGKPKDQRGEAVPPQAESEDGD